MRTRDWTIGKYKELCEVATESGREVMGVGEYLTITSPERKLVIRHDIDLSCKSAFPIAGLESCYQFRTSYYFRKRTFDPKIVYEISSLGHEIGYHYEVLDRSKGNFDVAKDLFTEELNLFRKEADIKTVCAHLNPVTVFDNRDFWKEYRLEDFGLIGEAYLSMNSGKTMYFTDTDRTWEETDYEFKDLMLGEDKAKRPKVKTTDELLAFIKKYSGDVYLNIHPERWANNFIDYAKMRIRDALSCQTKFVLKSSPNLRKLLSYVYN